MVKTIPKLELELCLNQEITVYCLNNVTDEEEIFTGKLTDYGFPWQVLLEQPKEEGSRITTETNLTFAGPKRGITRIEKEGKVVYRNIIMSQSYPAFDRSENCWDELNEFREKLFGEEFRYMIK